MEARRSTRAPAPAKRAKTGEDEAKEPGAAQWSRVRGLLTANFNSVPSSKVLGFDVDSTLITTKSGKTFAVNENDWKLLYDSIPAKVQEKVAEGFRVVFFTNQKGVKSGQVTEAQLKHKFANIVAALGVPALVMAAVDDDEFRKPCTGMWDYLSQNLNEGVDLDVGASIYVGDAAGRPAKGSRKKDFNDTDLKFALNIGLTFNTPEQFFLGQSEIIPTPSFDPRNFSRSGSLFINDNSTTATSDTTEMIIFVGAPASGKSTFWQNHCSQYVRVNQDQMKTKEKCFKAAEQALASGQSCVIDNTNAAKQTRIPYIQLAQKYNVPVRAFDFTSNKHISFHLDTLREVNSHRNHLSKRVGSIPIHKFFKDYEAPSTSEGFAEVKQVNFVGGPFENEEDERMFFSFVYS